MQNRNNKNNSWYQNYDSNNSGEPRRRVPASPHSRASHSGKRKNNIKMVTTLVFMLIVTAAFLAIFYQSVQRANAAPENEPNNMNQTIQTQPPVTKQPGTDPSPSGASAPKVVLDPGHGGFDVGKEGSLGLKNEDTLNLSLTKKIGALLISKGVTVVYTRSDDNALGATKEEDMQKRVDITNSSHADAFISIHMNSFPTDTSVRGPEVYYYSENPQGQNSRGFAEQMQQSLNQFTGTRRSYKHEDFMVTRESTIPAILIECGFLSNKKDAENLNSDTYQQQLAEVISNCIYQYIQ